MDAIAFYTNVDSGVLTAAKRKPLVVVYTVVHGTGGVRVRTVITADAACLSRRCVSGGMRQYALTFQSGE